MKYFTSATKLLIVPVMLLGMVAAPAHADPAHPDPVRDEKIRQEILNQAQKLKKESRDGDTSKWDQMVAQDYAEFNPYFPFLLDPPKAVSVAMQKEFDEHDRLPPYNRPNLTQKIQVYGDVALLTYTGVGKGTLVGPGFMSQAKFLCIYVKKNDIWVLVQTHDGRRVGPDGLPID